MDKDRLMEQAIKLNTNTNTKVNNNNNSEITHKLSWPLGVLFLPCAIVMTVGVAVCAILSLTFAALIGKMTITVSK